MNKTRLLLILGEQSKLQKIYESGLRFKMGGIYENLGLEENLELTKLSSISRIYCDLMVLVHTWRIIVFKFCQFVLTQSLISSP